MPALLNYAALLVIGIQGISNPHPAAKDQAGLSILLSGAKCDGHSLDNDALTRTLLQTSHVLIPAQTCIIDSFDLPSGTTIEGVSSQSQVKPGPSGLVFRITGTPASPRRSLTFKGLAFARNDDVSELDQIAIAVSAADGINVSRCSATNLQLLLTNPGIGYSSMAGDLLVRNVSFENNQCVSNQVKRQSCGNFTFVSNARVEHNSVRGYQHGLMYWGGDSNKDGDPGNIRWARQISFTGNDISGSGQGGIWGSMGSEITIAGNTVADVGDVGIDFEGTQGGLADNNRCNNARNGCGTTFFLNRDIVFINNKFHQPVANQPLFRIYNVSQTPANRNISITNNFLYCDDPVNTCSADDAMGPAALVTFTHNQLFNVVIAFDSNNTGRVLLEDNSLTFSHPIRGAAISVQSFGASSLIRSNHIKALNTQSTSAAAIDVRDADFNYSNSYQIQDNEVIGFPTSIRVLAAGQNVGTSVSFNICGNSLHGGRFIRDDRASIQPSSVAFSSSACKASKDQRN